MPSTSRLERLPGGQVMLRETPGRRRIRGSPRPRWRRGSRGTRIRRWSPVICLRGGIRRALQCQAPGDREHRRGEPRDTRIPLTRDASACHRARCGDPRGQDASLARRPGDVADGGGCGQHVQRASVRAAERAGIARLVRSINRRDAQRRRAANSTHSGARALAIHTCPFASRLMPSGARMPTAAHTRRFDRLPSGAMSNAVTAAMPASRPRSACARLR